MEQITESKKGNEYKNPHFYRNSGSSSSRQLLSVLTLLKRSIEKVPV